MPEQSNQEYGKGYFLIANPVLPDPNFSRTVVLLCNHDDEGSFGLVINRSALINSKEVFKEMGDIVLGDLKLINKNLPPRLCKKAERETVKHLQSKPVDHN